MDPTFSDVNKMIFINLLFSRVIQIPFISLMTKFRSLSKFSQVENVDSVEF